MNLYDSIVYDVIGNGSGGGGGGGNSLGDYLLKTIVNAEVPEGVKTFLPSFFKGCNKLETISLPSTLTAISSSCFEGCSKLNTITIPENVTTLENRVFYGCSGLTSITSLATTPPTIGGGMWHTGVSNTIPIYVPAESVEAYKSASFWSNRADYIQPIPE